MIEKLSLDATARTLKLEWTDGSMSKLSAKTLRSEARDAASVRLRHDNIEIIVDSDLEITAMEQVGAMGVNIHFSDGHRRAIYPFSYLRELSDRFDN